jgi:hypothetical protein
MSDKIFIDAVSETKGIQDTLTLIWNAVKELEDRVRQLENKLSLSKVEGREYRPVTHQRI